MKEITLEPVKLLPEEQVKARYAALDIVDRLKKIPELYQGRIKVGSIFEIPTELYGKMNLCSEDVEAMQIITSHIKKTLGIDRMKGVSLKLVYEDHGFDGIFSYFQIVPTSKITIGKENENRCKK